MKGILAQIQESVDNGELAFVSSNPNAMKEVMDAFQKIPTKKERPQHIIIGRNGLMEMPKDRIAYIMRNCQLMTDTKGYEYLKQIGLA